MPSFSQRPGTTQTSSQPRLTQARAESASAAVWPPSSPSAAQASAKSGSDQQRQRRPAAADEPAERQRRQRRHRDQGQLGEEAGAGRVERDGADHDDDRERQQQRPPAAPQARQRGSVRWPARGAATRAAWTRLRAPIESQKGSTPQARSAAAPAALRLVLARRRRGGALARLQAAGRGDRPQHRQPVAGGEGDVDPDDLRRAVPGPTGRRLRRPVGRAGRGPRSGASAALLSPPGRRRRNQTPIAARP